MAGKKVKKTEVDWQTEVVKLKPFMFKVLTPSGHGTGFLIFKNDKKICGVATACHVVAHAIDWREPIKLRQYSTGQEIFLPHDDNIRVIKFDAQRDLALIMFMNNENFILDDELPELLEVDKIVDQGTKIGWNGFPVIASDYLCFFSGHISCYLQNEESYLIDGVSIHGVSGAPAFIIDKDTSKIKICGLISSYHPNTSTGQPLPGLAKIRSVTPLKQECENLKSLDEAARQTEESRVEEKASTSTQ